MPICSKYSPISSDNFFFLFYKSLWTFALSTYCFQKKKESNVAILFIGIKEYDVTRVSSSLT